MKESEKLEDALQVIKKQGDYIIKLKEYTEYLAQKLDSALDSIKKLEKLSSNH